MRGFIIHTLATVVGLFVFILLFFLLAIASAPSKPPLPGTMVLSLDLRKELSDKASTDPFAQLSGDRESVMGIVLALARAERDDRVKGLYVRIGAGMSALQVSELREAIQSFRDAGKFVTVHAQSLYQPTLGDYYLATAADEVWMQRESHFFSSGIAGRGVFAKDMLEHLGIKAQWGSRYEYKTAAHIFTEDDFTGPNRESTERLVSSLYDTIVTKAAADRGMEREQMVALLNAAPHTSEEAAAAGLIDHIGYDFDVEKAVKERAGARAEIVTIARYRGAAGSPFDKGPTIAFVHGDGAIVEGDGSGGPFVGQMFGGDTIAKAIHDAIDDDDVRAIVFRVNSGGGSATASDQVLNAVNRAREAGKPVIVSMAEVAASGGYWVSANANRIVAHDTTITGSIGVLYGKLVTRGLFEKIGVNIVEIAEGDRTLMMSGSREFSDADWEAVNKFLDTIYDGFLVRVSEGRGLTIEEVHNVGRGRVWTGVDARDLGLVDELGGFRTALRLAMAEAGIGPDERVTLKEFPRRPTPIEQLLKMFGMSTEAARVLVAIGALTRTEPIARMIEAIEVSDGKPAIYEPTRAR
jgi:protease-4